MHKLSLLLVAVTALAHVGCGQNYVRVDDVALGRVVVYRNGVAYYERRATVTGDELSMMVPRDKVDDFLKSLTVADAKTGESLPVTFDRNGSSGSVVDMIIRLPKGHSTDLVLTYITESPAWKPSYRIVAKDDGSVLLQSWAVVDNTSAETWKDVLVGVGSSAALSFRYDLFSVRDVQRKTLASDERLAIAPPTGSSPHGGKQTANILAQLGDDELQAPKPVDTTSERPPMPSPAEPMVDESVSIQSSGGSGGYSRARRKPRVSKKEKARRDKMNRIRLAQERKRQRERLLMQRKLKRSEARVKSLAAQLKNSGKKIVINGYADAGERDAQVRSLDRANHMRNRLIAAGVAPAQLEVAGNGAVAGKRSGVELAATTEPVGKADQAESAQGSDKPVGESHFQSKQPMTVKSGTSVMVSLIKKETPGEIVYLYDPESERGNQRFAFKSLRFKNPTKDTLEAGPVTVYRKGGFIGEGLTEPIPPDSSAIVPFALDRQIVVNRDKSTSDRIAKLVSIDRGILRAELSHTRVGNFKLTNRMNKTATVYVRHTVQPGWKLSKAPARVERLGDAHLFRIKVPPHSTKEVSIEEVTPISKTVDLRSTAAIDMIRLYISDAGGADKALLDKLQGVLELHRNIADRELAIETQRKRLSDYRVRMDELHAQIVTLKVVRSGGSLMKHLKSKMQGISERVQKATIQVVESEEKLMLARIRFQDALAELSLEKRPAMAKKSK